MDHRLDGPRRTLAMAAVGVTCLGWVLAPPAPAEEPSASYDEAGVAHNEQCIATAGDRPVVVRDVEGNQLQTATGPLNDSPEQAETCSARPGIRFQGIEAVSAGAMTMYYVWPLEGGRQSPGFVWVGELAAPPIIEAADAAGNGEPAPPAVGEPAYRITPEDIAFEQRYRGPSTGRWYTYSVYGRAVGAAKFALMTWSWIDVEGGGIARAAVAEGELFYPADVQAISLSSSSGEGQPANGTVTVRYGYVFAGSTKIYGWMVTSHVFDGICYDHMAYAGGGTPLAETLCPTAGAGVSSGVSPYQASLDATLPGLSEDL
jgi:hypothetical protein